MRYLLLLLLGGLATAQAQDRGYLGVVEGRQATVGGYYVNAQPGEPVTRVNVVGQVLRPGVYDVGPDFDLQSVLALAGLEAERGDDPSKRELLISLYRAGQSVAVYEAPLSTLLAQGAPAIEYGDVLRVRATGSATVGIWGTVARPGIFEVGPTISRRDALALAGGPEFPSLRNSQTRRTELEVFGPDQAQPLFRGTLEEYLAAGPPLRDGQVIQVQTSVDQGWTTRDTLAAAGVATSATIAVVQFLRLLRVD